jgi:hypothetical protein
MCVRERVCVQVACVYVCVCVCVYHAFIILFSDRVYTYCAFIGFYVSV